MGRLISRSSSSSSSCPILWSVAEIEDIEEEDVAECWNVLKANCGPIQRRRWGPKCVRISTCDSHLSSSPSWPEGTECSAEDDTGGVEAASAGICKRAESVR